MKDYTTPQRHRNRRRSRRNRRIAFLVTLAILAAALLTLMIGAGIMGGGDGGGAQKKKSGKESSQQDSGGEGMQTIDPSSRPDEGEVPDSLDTDDPSSDSPGTDGLPQGSLSDWNLILLNPEPDNRIEAEIKNEKEEFDGQLVDARAGAAYEEMRAAAAQEGITLFLRSGYRSIAVQEANYNRSVQTKMDAGSSREEAVRLTNLYYTQPGHSEHHSGLAFDIITPEYHHEIYELDDRFADTQAYAWLRENCASFGFILRYPKEKEDVTQINFEPWHYRYVGREHAQYIMGNGLCLEEYIDMLRAAGR